MYNGYIKLKDKIVAVDDNNLVIFKNGETVENYIETENNISLIKEKIEADRKEIQGLSGSKAMSKTTALCIPIGLVMVHGMVLIMHYRYGVELKYSVNTAINWLVGSSIFTVAGDILINKSYKKKKRDLVNEINYLEVLGMRYLNKKQDLEKEVKVEKIKTTAIDKKEKLEKIKEELESLRQLKEEEKPKEKTLGSR